MKYCIDPKIDCVFKALLGSREHRHLLVHFLNAMLGNDLSTPIKAVEILNPYNEKEFLDDKLNIVDVKAIDEREQLFQIEIQMLSYGYLMARIFYNWADLYSKQLQSGDDYSLLKPTYSIWLLAEDLIKTDTDYLHVCTQFFDTKGRKLLAHGGIWIIELNKFAAHLINNEHERWLQFFKNADQLDDTALPYWMKTTEMSQAMTILRQFSEKEINYHRYQARQEYLRQQRAIRWEMEEERKGKHQALLREQAAVREKDVAIQRENQAVQELEVAIQRENQAIQEKEAAIQRENQAIQEREVAIQRENQAMQEREVAIQRENQAMQEREVAIQRENQAIREREIALSEIERIKALLVNHKAE